MHRDEIMLKVYLENERLFDHTAIPDKTSLTLWSESVRPATLLWVVVVGPDDDNEA